MKRSPVKSYVRWLLGPVVVVLFLAAVINTVVNPLRVTPLPWSIAALEPYRVVEHYERTAKAGYVRSSDWQGAIFGSSRMDIGVNPAHLSLAGIRTANLALSAGKLTENVEMMRYACAQEKLSLIVFGIDLIDLAEPVRVAKTDFYSSPLAHTGSALDRELQYYFGLMMLKNSGVVLGRAWRGVPGEHLPNGHWVLNHPIDPRRDAEVKSLAQAFGLSRNRSAATERINPQKAAMVREIIRLSREENARLIIVLPPNHACFNAALYLAEDVDPGFRAEREFLTRLIAEDNAAHPAGPAAAVWDFDDFHPRNCEPIPAKYGGKMNEWRDVTHAGPSIGDLILAAITGLPQNLAAGQEFYGAQLTPATLDAHLAARDAGFRRYREERPAEITWIESILADLKANASKMMEPEEE